MEPIGVFWFPKGLKTIWGVGSGGSGVLCNENLDDRDIFSKVLELEKGQIRQISLGGKKAILMTDEGQLMEWGELEEKGKVFRDI